MAGSFTQYTESMALDLEALMNRGMRAAAVAAVKAAVKATDQDSANAAVHWLIGVPGAKRTSLGPFGRLRDLRGRVGRMRATKKGSLVRRGAKGPKHPVVGYRGDKKGRGDSAAVNFVVDRARPVIQENVSGRNAQGKFFLYNAVALKNDDDLYAGNANIEAAGIEGMNAAEMALNRHIIAGTIRKRFRP